MRLSYVLKGWSTVGILVYLGRHLQNAENIGGQTQKSTSQENMQKTVIFCVIKK